MFGICIFEKQVEHLAHQITTPLYLDGEKDHELNHFLDKKL